MKNKYALITTILLTFALMAQAQDEMFIYGKIKTDDGKEYEGPIRWGKEEVYWSDIFNASKMRNENLRYLSDRQRDELDNRRYRNDGWLASRVINWVSDYDEDYVHQFACQFGEIRSLRPTGRNYAELEMKNGDVIEVSGEGYNDIGLDIRVTDQELGEVEIYWGRIDKIEFMNTPRKLEQKFGEPLYGTVEAFGTKFTGYIQWDLDERLSTDKLDGDSDDGDVSIAFGKIRSIEKRGSRSLVALKSGRTMTLDGSNDVSHGHRGVVVMTADLPAVKIPWDEFDKLVLEDSPKGTLPAYNQFSSPKKLRGKVVSEDGTTISGDIVFDLDEAFDYELLQGTEDEFEYTAPFRNVKRLSPKSEYRCLVEFKSGKSVILEEGQDVDKQNQGLLVFSANSRNPVYIPWNEISEIVFE
jgi:hypothetical protein